MTAEEFLENQKLKIIHNSDRSGIAYPDWWCEQKMIEFAKYHVEQALNAAYQNSEVRVTENALIEDGCCYTTYDDGVISVTTDKQSILDAYSLDNIV